MKIIAIALLAAAAHMFGQVPSVQPPETEVQNALQLSFSFAKLTLVSAQLSQAMHRLLAVDMQAQLEQEKTSEPLLNTYLLFRQDFLAKISLLEAVLSLGENQINQAQAGPDNGLAHF